MKAAVLHEPGPLLPVEEVDLEAPKHGEVLVDMVGAGVCHSDYHMLSGKLNLPMPLVMGHEGAGIVSETGPGVTGFSPGDKVIFSMEGYPFMT
jgi:S-(hydroxymethyl)glutathione dehydrogenase/alcohol dehydrogenase